MQILSAWELRSKRRFDEKMSYSPMSLYQTKISKWLWIFQVSPDDAIFTLLLYMWYSMSEIVAYLSPRSQQPSWRHQFLTR